MVESARSSCFSKFAVHTASGVKRNPEGQHYKTVLCALAQVLILNEPRRSVSGGFSTLVRHLSCVDPIIPSLRATTGLSTTTIRPRLTISPLQACVEES